LRVIDATDSSPLLLAVEQPLADKAGYMDWLMNTAAVDQYE